MLKKTVEELVTGVPGPLSEAEFYGWIGYRTEMNKRKAEAYKAAKRKG